MVSEKYQKYTTPEGLKAQKTSKIYAGDLFFTYFQAHMDPKEGGGRRPPPSFGSGRRPRPYICFKNRQNIGSGLYFLYFLTPEAVSGCIFFVFFWVPPESSILYMLCIVVYSSGSPQNGRFCIFGGFSGTPKSPVCGFARHYSCSMFTLVRFCSDL